MTGEGELIAGRRYRLIPRLRQIQYIHAVLRNALSNAERDESITRNVAKLVQIPAPRYKIGKGLPVSDVKHTLAEAQHTRLYALNALAATLGFRRGELLEGYAKPSLKKYRPIAARNEDKKVFSGLL